MYNRTLFKKKLFLMKNNIFIVWLTGWSGPLIIVFLDA